MTQQNKEWVEKNMNRYASVHRQSLHDHYETEEENKTQQKNRKKEEIKNSTIGGF